MTTQGKSTVTRADAEGVAHKLQGLRAGMSESEQAALDNVLGVFAARVEQANADDLLKDFPEAPQLLEDVSGFQLAAAPQQPQEATVTTVTVTTVFTSSRYLCDIKMAGR